MLLAEVVEASARVAGTPARSAKIAALADLLRRLEPGEVEPTVGFLVGEPRQGRIGVGWATLSGRLAAHRQADTPVSTDPAHGRGAAHLGAPPAAPAPPSPGLARITPRNGDDPFPDRGGLW